LLNFKRGLFELKFVDICKIRERGGIMDKNLISVIVPVYKAEAYLEACVNSILAQTYTQLEVILVDDSSPDGSGTLCDLMAERDARIRVLHKENGGVSSARNAGLDIAQGEYIAFVDSDDTIDNDMYEKLYMRLKETGADMGVCGYKMVYKEYKRMKRVPVERVYSAKQVWEGYMNAFRSYYTIFSSSWNKLIKKDIVETHRFPEWLRTAEDGWFIANCVTDCHNCRLYAIQLFYSA